MPIDLPVEVIHDILVHAAKSSASTCRTLCGVSAWVRDLALPLLYTTVSIHAITTVVSTRVVCPPNPTFDPAKCVRNIWGHDHDDQWETVALQCPNVSYLAIGSGNFEKLIEAVESLSDVTNAPMGTSDLHMLLLGPTDNEDDWTLNELSNDNTRHFFKRFTHLRLWDPVLWDESVNISHMDRLTHLAIHCSDAGEGKLKAMLDLLENTSVEVFVWMLSHDSLAEDDCQDVEDWVCGVRNEGAQGVYAVRHQDEHLGDLEKEWDAEVRGGVTIWGRAVEHTQLLMYRAHNKIDSTMAVDQLPREVIHMILLYVAQSSTASCRVLCEVSTWVRHLALPLLYQTVSFDSVVRLRAFVRSISCSPLMYLPSPTFRPAHVVRHLWIPLGPESFEPMMGLCINVAHITIRQYHLLRLAGATKPGAPSPGDETEPTELEGLCIIALRNIQHDSSPRFDPTSVLVHPLLARITHLQLEVLGDETLKWPIAHMPRLTHLAIPCEGDLDLDYIYEVLVDTSVEVFVWVLTHRYQDKADRRAVENWVHNSRKQDERIYVGKQLYSSSRKEWDAEVRGGATIWERAVEHTQGLMSKVRRRWIREASASP